MEPKLGDLVCVSQSRGNAMCLSRCLYFQGVYVCVSCKAEDNKITLEFNVEDVKSHQHRMGCTYRGEIINDRPNEVC